MPIAGEPSPVGASLAGPPSDLRAQLQPFKAYTPQQVQEQLQQIHITEPAFDQPQPPLGGGASSSGMEFGAGYGVLDGVGPDGTVVGVAVEGLDSGGGESESDSDSTESHSRKNSTSSHSSLLSQLLSPASSDIPLGPKDPAGLHQPGTGYSLSPPNGLLHPPRMRRHSSDDNQSTQFQAVRKQRNTLPELIPQAHLLLDRTAPLGLAGGQFPGFPLTREGSPTKLVSGRRSPHETMDAIAEDITEDSSEIPYGSRTPSPNSLRYSAGSPSQQGSLSGQSSPRQRRTGVTLNSPSLQRELAATLQAATPPRKSSGSNSLEALLTPLQPPAQPRPTPAFQPPLPLPPHLHPVFNIAPQVCHQVQAMNCINAGLAMAPPTNGNLVDVLTHVQSVLHMCGVAFHHHANGVFEVEHGGVRLQILVRTACVPNLASQSAIQLQYLAGDTTQYQTLCNHLAMQLQLSA